MTRTSTARVDVAVCSSATAAATTATTHDGGDATEQTSPRPPPPTAAIVRPARLTGRSTCTASSRKDASKKAAILRPGRSVRNRRGRAIRSSGDGASCAGGGSGGGDYTLLRPDECKRCGARLKRPRDVKRHALTHEAKRFGCPLGCTTMYSRRDALQRHVRDWHQQELPLSEPATAPAAGQERVVVDGDGGCQRRVATTVDGPLAQARERPTSEDGDESAGTDVVSFAGSDDDEDGEDNSGDCSSGESTRRADLRRQGMWVQPS
ncbi:hypothetical protein HK405_013386 [Cladochytrium tenue]|nr:hypothetical protein HK405_013386 [Cladochytrium tenue]